MYSLFRISILLSQRIFIRPFLQTSTTGQRRQPILPQRSQHALLPRPLKVPANPQRPLLLRSDQLLTPRLAHQLPLRRARAAHAQQRHRVCLADERQLRVRAPRVPPPVRVLGDVARGDGDGVREGEGVVGARRRVAELRVQGHAVGARGVDGEEAADALVDARGLDGVLLRVFSWLVGKFKGGRGMVEGMGWWEMYLVDGDDAVGYLSSFSCCLGGHDCSFERTIDSLRRWNWEMGDE